MNLSELENRFKGYLHYAESDPSLTDDEEDTKYRVWSKVMRQISAHKRRILYQRMAVAATIIFLMFSLFTIKTIINKNAVITQLRGDLEKIEKDKEQLELRYTSMKEEVHFLKSKPPIIDTVFQTKIVYRTPDLFSGDYLADLNENEDYPFTENPQIILLGHDKLDLRNAEPDIQNLKIEYGEATEDGTIPWAFSVSYQ